VIFWLSSKQKQNKESTATLINVNSSKEVIKNGKANSVR
jgi:hypothetical protein